MKAIIFDLFETLVDFSFDEYNETLSRMAECLGVDLDTFISEWHGSWPQHEEGAFSTIEDYIRHTTNGRFSKSGIAEAAMLHRQFEERVLTARPDGLNALHNVRARGYRTGLVTNCAIETPSLWGQAALSALIDEPVFSTVEKLRKPDPELFQRCAQRLHVSPKQCVFVGDGANDEMRSARSAGLTPVLLVNGDGKGSDWDGYAVSKLTELLEVLDGMDALKIEPTD